MTLTEVINAVSNLILIFYIIGTITKIKKPLGCFFNFVEMSPLSRFAVMAIAIINISIGLMLYFAGVSINDIQLNILKLAVFLLWLVASSYECIVYKVTKNGN